MGAANKRLAQARPREAGIVPSAIYAESGVRNPDPALPLQFHSRRVADDAAAAGDRSYAPLYRWSSLPDLPTQNAVVILKARSRRHRRRDRLQQRSDARQKTETVWHPPPQ